MLDKWNIDVVNDGPRKASFKRALEVSTWAPAHTPPPEAGLRKLGG